MQVAKRRRGITMLAAGSALAVAGCGGLGLDLGNVPLSDAQVKAAVVPPEELEDLGIKDVEYQGQQRGKTLRTRFNMTGVSPKGECAEVIKTINNQRQQVHSQVIFRYRVSGATDEWSGIITSIDDADADPFGLYGKLAEVCTQENLETSPGAQAEFESVDDGAGVFLTMRYRGQEIKLAAAGMKLGQNHAIVYAQAPDLEKKDVEAYLEKQKSALAEQVKKAEQS